jgi:hypothetical protein
MYDDDDGSMTSMPRLVHRKKDIRLLLLFLFFFFFFFVFLFVIIRSFDDVSQCVDMKKQDDTATITTAATAVASQRFRGLINLTKIE